MLSIDDPKVAGNREGLQAPLVSRRGLPQQTKGSSQVRVSTQGSATSVHQLLALVTKDHK